MARSSRRRDSNQQAARSADTTLPRRPWYHRIPLGPVGFTLTVLVTALFATAPIRDAATLAPTAEGHLRLPMGYVLVAPASDILDTLTLLTVPQHIALLCWVLGLYGAFRWMVRRRSPKPTVRAEVIGIVGLFGGLLLVYAAVAYLPRPMARLESTHDDVFIADFHVHTKYSHDGRKSWTPARVRAWEHAAGYDVAYISDHRTFEGAEEAAQSNPRTASDGTVLLQAIEVIYGGEHVNLLSAGTRYRNLTSSDLRDIDVPTLALMSTLTNVEPVIIETLPGNLSKIQAANGPGTPGVRAIEIVDGSPRGLTQTRRSRAQIVALSTQQRLALVAGSDNHGYGRAAAGWTLLRADDWRVLSPDSLSKMIELILRAAGPEASRVIERRVGSGDNAILILLTPLVVPWRMFTTLSLEERVAWVIWIWTIALALSWWRKRAGLGTS